CKGPKEIFFRAFVYLAAIFFHLKSPVWAFNTENDSSLNRDDRVNVVLDDVGCHSSVD
ncbi:MAG: hypothetical protein ACD_6C00294G0001, partial [uncultured bacterium]